MRRLALQSLAMLEVSELEEILRVGYVVCVRSCRRGRSLSAARRPQLDDVGAARMLRLGVGVGVEQHLAHRQLAEQMHRIERRHQRAQLRPSLTDRLGRSGVRGLPA